MDMKIIDSSCEIPVDVLADVFHEYYLVYADVVCEIEYECELDGCLPRGSVFNHRLSAYDDYFNDLFIRLVAEHGYIYRHLYDCI